MTPLLTINNVAEMLGVKPDTVRRMCYARRIPHIKLAKFIRFDRADIEEWMKKNKVRVL